MKRRNGLQLCLALIGGLMLAACTVETETVPFAPARPSMATAPVLAVYLR